jgi:hypothetical protein
MVPIGLLDKIGYSVEHIATGRKALDTVGKAEAGLISYHLGLDSAMKAFTEAAISADAESMILVEHAFLTEEKRFCDPSDVVAISSLTAATDSFDDALLALKAVCSVTLYAGIEMGFPHSIKYRINKMPKDAFHIACIAHRTRLKNIQSTPGLNMLEKSIYKQRSENMRTAQRVYMELQKNILESRE